MAQFINAQTLTNLSSYPNTFQRGSAFPLDQSSLFSTLEAAQTYASTDAKAYIGQVLTVATDFGEWQFSVPGENGEQPDNKAHTLRWLPDYSNTGAWQFDNGTPGDYYGGQFDEDENCIDIYFLYEESYIHATRSPRSVKVYVINADHQLVELGTASAISGGIENLDVSSTPLFSINDNVITLKAIKEVDGIVSTDTTAGKTVTFAKVAKTGNASDVAITDNESFFTSENVEGALEELHQSIQNSTVDIQQGNTDGTIKWRNGFSGNYTEVTPKNLKTVATSGDINDVKNTSAITSTKGVASSIAANTTGNNIVKKLLENIDDNKIRVDTVTTGLNSGILKAYQIYAGGTASIGSGTLIATIDIPKDLVISSGKVVTFTAQGKDPDTGFTNYPTTAGDANTKYLRLVIANQAEPVYIKVSDLVDVYTSNDTSSTPIQINISDSNVISATCNISGSATIATVSDGIVTLKSGVSQTSGAISQGSGNDIALAKVATTGDANDVLMYELESPKEGYYYNTPSGNVFKFENGSFTHVASSDAKDHDYYGGDSTDELEEGDSPSEINIKKNLAEKIIDLQSETDSKITNAINNLDTSSDVTIASNSNGVVTLKAGIKEVDGVIQQGTGSDITLAKVATTGSGSDVTYTTGNNGESVSAALTRLDGSNSTTGSVAKKIKDAIDALDTTNDVSLVTVNDSVVTLKTGIKEENGIVKQGTGSDITLAKVAKTGKAEDVSITDSGNKFTATTVEAALAELKTDISNHNVDAEGDSYVGASASGNKVTVSTNNTTSTTDISNATSSTKKLVDAYTAKQYVAGIIEGLDATKDTGTPASASNATNGDDTTNKIAVVTKIEVVETDGKITSVSKTTTDVATPTAVGAVKTIANSKVQFRGTTTSDISTTGTGKYGDKKTITINNASVECNVGDIAIYNGIEYRLTQTATSPAAYLWKKYFVEPARTIAGVDLQDDITKAEMLTALNVADGAQVNVIETVKVGGTALTVTNKAVDIDNLILDCGSATEDIA